MADCWPQAHAGTASAVIARPTTSPDSTAQALAPRWAALACASDHELRKLCSDLHEEGALNCNQPSCQPALQVIDAEMGRRKLLEDAPVASINDDPVNFDTDEIPWWAWVQRFHLPEVR